MTFMTVKLSPLWHGSGQSWVHPSGRGLVQGSSQTWHSLPAYTTDKKNTGKWNVLNNYNYYYCYWLQLIKCWGIEDYFEEHFKTRGANMA